MKHVLMFIYADAPIHCGGATSDGAIDLPIQREATTNHPVIWGQSLKGAIREVAQAESWPDLPRIFGSAAPGGPGSGSAGRPAPPAGDGEEASEQAEQRSSKGSKSGGGALTLDPGQVSFGDARLVALPVATTQRGFAWATSPMLVSRLGRSAGLSGVDAGPTGQATAPVGDSDFIPCDNNWAKRVGVGDYVLHRGPVNAGLKDVAEKVANHLPSSAGYFAAKMQDDLIQVSDTAFKALAKSQVQTVARVQLHADRKAVKHGPWMEEYLPPESVLVSLLSVLDDADVPLLDSLRDKLHGRAIPFGGNWSVGKGLAWVSFAAPQPATAEGGADAA